MSTAEWAVVRGAAAVVSMPVTDMADATLDWPAGFDKQPLMDALNRR
jgi:hypothetical protein